MYVCVGGGGLFGWFVIDRFLFQAPFHIAVNNNLGKMLLQFHDHCTAAGPLKPWDTKATFCLSVERSEVMGSIITSILLSSNIALETDCS